MEVRSSIALWNDEVLVEFSNQSHATPRGAVSMGLNSPPGLGPSVGLGEETAVQCIGPAQVASASSSPSSAPHRSLAAACISGFLALPLPVAWSFSLLRWIVAQGNPASSQASTAAPSMGNSALTLLNCPENGSSMQTPVQSGPAKRWTTP